MEKLRQGPMLHLGVKGLDDDDDIDDAEQPWGSPSLI
jgi:hypothetical protein